MDFKRYTKKVESSVGSHEEKAGHKLVTNFMNGVKGGLTGSDVISEPEIRTA